METSTRQPERGSLGTSRASADDQQGRQLAAGRDRQRRADRVLDRRATRSSPSAWNGLAWSAAATPLSAPLDAGTISDLRVSIAGHRRRCCLAPRRQRRHGADCGWHLDGRRATRRPRPPRLRSQSPRTAVDSPRSPGRTRPACRSQSRPRVARSRPRPVQPTPRRASRPSASPRPARCSSRRCRVEPCRHEIRSAGGTWGSETSLGSGSAPSVSADSSGDVVVSWPGSIRVYDASPPSVSVVAPASPASPGSHDWSVTTSDVWSGPGTTSWSFDDNGTVVNGGTGATVSHVDNNPGPETATATQTDGAGNTATDSATITISPVGPHNNAAPTITNGSAPADGDTLTTSPGSWTGNPTPNVSHVWQRCNRDVPVDRPDRFELSADGRRRRREHPQSRRPRRTAEASLSSTASRRRMSRHSRPQRRPSARVRRPPSPTA